MRPVYVQPLIAESITAPQISTQLNSKMRRRTIFLSPIIFCASPKPPLALQYHPPQKLFENAQPLLEGQGVKLGDIHFVDASSKLPHAVKISRDPNNTFRFEARTGEKAIWDHKHNSYVDRAEIAALDRKNRIPYGTEFFWSFGIMIEEGAVTHGDWCVLSQLHQSGLHPNPSHGKNPPLAIYWHSEGFPGLSIATRSGSTQEIVHPYIKPRIIYHDDCYPRGKWNNFAIQCIFNWEGNALLKIWRNGQLIAHKFGPEFSLGYEWDAAPTKGCYGQFGIYRASASPGNPWNNADANPMAVQFRNVKLHLQRY